MNQVELHPTWHQRDLRAFCREKGIHLSAYCPLGSPDQWAADGLNRKCTGARSITTHPKPAAARALRCTRLAGAPYLPTHATTGSPASSPIDPARYTHQAPRGLSGVPPLADDRVKDVAARVGKTPAQVEPHPASPGLNAGG